MSSPLKFWTFLRREKDLKTKPASGTCAMLLLLLVMHLLRCAQIHLRGATATHPFPSFLMTFMDVGYHPGLPRTRGSWAVLEP